MTDLMIDLETLSVKPNALILTIGAIKFDRNGEISEKIEDTDSFYVRIQNNHTDTSKFDIDPETQKWWHSQPWQARYEAMHNPDRMFLKEALIKFSKWFEGSEYIWANGSVFDVIIMEHAFRVCELPIPWKFWLVRDVRTIMEVGGVSKKEFNIVNAHHALHDCHWQIQAVQKALKNLEK